MILFQRIIAIVVFFDVEQPITAFGRTITANAVVYHLFAEDLSTGNRS